MSRALLEQAHAALDTCESMTGYYHDERAVSAAMTAITAALAQPEPSPTHGMTLGDRIAHVGGRVMPHGYIEFGSLMAVNALIQHVLRDVSPPAPITYRNPADDVALKRSFDAMESGIVAELRKELADMTAQRDRLMWGHAQVCEKADADRLDAQRYRDTRTIYCASNGVSESDSDDQADLYIEAHRDLLAKATGGQP